VSDNSLSQLKREAIGDPIKAAYRIKELEEKLARTERALEKVKEQRDREMWDIHLEEWFDEKQRDRDDAILTAILSGNADKAGGGDK